MRTGENISKRKDGRWEARIVIGRRPDGQIRYKYLYAKTYREVKQKKTEFEQNLQKYSSAPEKNRDITFGKTAQRWLMLSKNNWKPATYVKYRICLEHYLLPHWKDRMLHSISQDDYEELFTELKNSLEASSLNAVNTILNGIIRYAVRQKLIPAAPFLMLRPSARRTSDTLEVLSSREMMVFTSYLMRAPDKSSLGMLIALYEGIRLGEVCALKWGDIDLMSQTIHICRTLQRIPNPDPDAAARTILHFDSPKSGRERWIPIHPELFDILKEAQKKYLSEDFVLSGNYKPVEPRTYTNQFKHSLKECGIRDINFHALRHTFASNCVEAGINIKALSEILGHSTIKITMDRYVHLSMQYKRGQISVLQFPVPSGQKQSACSSET